MVFVKNNKGDKIIINRNLLLEAKKELRKSIVELDEKVKKNQIKITGEELYKKVKKIYIILDKVMNNFDSYTTCKPTCNECCNQLIQITFLEGMLIDNYINNNFDYKKIRNLNTKNREQNVRKDSLQNFENIKELRKFYKDNSNIVNEYFKEENPCIFLSDKGLCEVYEVRPWSCRIHVSFSDIDKCKAKTKGEPKSLMKIQNQELLQFIQSTRDCIHHLNKIFLEEKMCTMQGYFEKGFEHMIDKGLFEKLKHKIKKFINIK